MKFINTSVILNSENKESEISIIKFDTVGDEISDNLFTEKHKLKEHTIQARRNFKREEESKKTGIDISTISNNMLESELFQYKNKMLYQTYNELGEKSYNNRLTKYQKFLLKVFPKINFNENYNELKYTDIKTLIRKIMLESNMIATKCRYGGADFIVTNGNIGSTLMDSELFKNEPKELGLYIGGEIYCIGRIGNIIIFVNPYLKWTDNTILLGRITKERQSGVYLVQNGKELITDNNSFTLKENIKFVCTDGSDKNFYKFKISLTKKEWWKYLLFIK